MIDRYFVLHINPEPWAMGEISHKRVSPNLTLRAFQEAVREELQGVESMPEGKYRLRFYFWRQTVRYIDPGDRVKMRNPADATNMQKAMEDALQGILFANDRDVAWVESILAAQGPDVEPCIIIRISLVGSDISREVAALPESIQHEKSQGPVKEISSNIWRGPSR